MSSPVTSNAIEAIQVARRRANEAGCSEVDTRHLLAAILCDERYAAAQLLRRLNQSLSGLADGNSLAAPPVSGRLDAEIPLSTSAGLALEMAAREAKGLGHSFIGTEHLLLGIAGEKFGEAARALANRGLTVERLRGAISQSADDHKSSDQLQSLESPQTRPVAESDRRFILDLYRAAVQYYQPLIEKRTGIKLGRIAVHDCALLGNQRWPVFWKGTLIALATSPILWWACTILPALTLRASDTFAILAGAGVVFMATFRRLRQDSISSERKGIEAARQCSAVYFNGGIYVSFESNTRHEDIIAAVVVHELAHALWHRISKETKYRGRRRAQKLGITKQYREFVEGFAVYAQQVEFAGLYPPKARSSALAYRWPADSVYDRGLRRVQAVIDRLGPEAFFKIPKQWDKL